MRAVFSSVVLVLCIIFFAEPAFACTCVLNSLSKRFRKAEAVFVGSFGDYKDESTSDVQNFRKGLPILEVKKAWKGVKKEYVAVDFDFEGATGGCPWFYRLEKGKEYLIFAYGKELKVSVECSDSRELTAKYDWTSEELGKLDSFWFRTKARLWPF
ncbi:MAG: hypothetical protein WKF92_08915 [Pyrinomonadaceae bacterium]